MKIRSRDDQRQRHPGPRHLVDPVGQRPRHHHGAQQLAAALRHQPRRRQRCRRGDRQRARRLLRHVQDTSASIGGKWIGVPWAVGGGLVTYRKSWLADIGYEKFPVTWDEWHDAGKKWKAAGHPIGQTLGHTFGDAPGFWYPYLWSWGGKEVEADGKTVALNSKETIESVKFAVPLLERLLRSGRAGLGQFQQQPRLPRRHHCRHQQRRLDLSRGQEEARRLPDRKGHADEGRHLARAARHRRRRAFQPSRPVHPTWSWAIRRTRRRPRISCAGSTRSRYSRNGSPRSRATPTARPRFGRTTRCGSSTR